MNHRTRSNALASTLSLTVLSLVGCTTAAPPADAAYADTSVLDASLGSPTIVMADGTSLVAVAGDILHLDVVLVSATGVHTPLPSGAVIEWTGPAEIIALASGSMPTTSQLPSRGLAPTGMFLRNREHYTDAQLHGVLIITDGGSAGGGTLMVDAHVTGAGMDANVSAAIPVGAVPGGDAASGQTFYLANCASCHGASGQGAAAPGLNHATGNVASDPDWNATLFASVPRANIDDFGVSEGPGMPLWLTTPATTGGLLTTQQMVNVYAWLLTQN